MNIQKKKKSKEKEKPKGERTSVPLPLSWNIYVKKQCRHLNRAGYNNMCELIGLKNVVEGLYSRVTRRNPGEYK